MVRRKLDGTNSRMVKVMTGKSAHEETTEGTRSFDLVRAIRTRSRRMTWLGHILRMQPHRMHVTRYYTSDV